MTSLFPITASNLSYSVDNKVLLDDISFELGGHGITAIMGPNGAGKSLLLRLINGLRRPDRGAVQFAGQSMNALHRQQLALVFQKPVLLRRTVAANLRFAVRDHRLSAGDIDLLLAQVGLEGKANQAARLLSGGEAQRLALARALARRPQLLCLDEATANLDPASTLAIENIIDEAVATGTRVIMVSHDAAQARRLANDVLFLQGGKLIEQATADRFFTQPQSLPARDYLQGRIHV